MESNINRNQYALEVIDLVKIYKNNLKALSGLSFKVRKGGIFGLLGANGAGKTTTIDIITSLTKKSSGKIFIEGIDTDQDFNLARSKLGVVPQEFNFNVFATPYHVLIIQAGYYGISSNIAKKRVEFLLKKLKLWDKRNTQMRHLSGGMKRRIMIARALVHSPDILLLDEPTAGVDVELRREILDFIKYLNKTGLTIILTTHYLEEAEQLCDNIGIIEHGQITKFSTMYEILDGLSEENIILTIDQKANILIENIEILKKYSAVIKDDYNIEVTIDNKGNDLNLLFKSLIEHNINVKSIKNKVNRLEQYFVNFTTSKLNK